MRIPPPANNWDDFIRRRHRMLAWSKKPERHFNNPIPKDRRCSMCERYEWTFALPVSICDKCAWKLNREDGISVQRKFSIRKGHICFFCRKKVFSYLEVGLKACQRCVAKIAAAVDKVKVKEGKIERKSAGKADL